MDERRALIPEKRIDESLGRVRADVAAARQNDSIISTTSPSLEANRPLRAAGRSGFVTNPVRLGGMFDVSCRPGPQV